MECQRISYQTVRVLEKDAAHQMFLAPKHVVTWPLYTDLTGDNHDVEQGKILGVLLLWALRSQLCL